MNKENEQQSVTVETPEAEYSPTLDSGDADSDGADASVGAASSPLHADRASGSSPISHADADECEEERCTTTDHDSGDGGSETLEDDFDDFELSAALDSAEATAAAEKKYSELRKRPRSPVSYFACPASPPRAPTDLLLQWDPKRIRRRDSAELAFPGSGGSPMQICKLRALGYSQIEKHEQCFKAVARVGKEYNSTLRNYGVFKKRLCHHAQLLSKLRDKEHRIRKVPLFFFVLLQRLVLTFPEIFFVVFDCS